ncbi:hypothetical protein [Hydrogenimonas sp.]
MENFRYFTKKSAEIGPLTPSKGGSGRETTDIFTPKRLYRIET